MEKIEAWKDSKGVIHPTEAECLTAETEIALLPFCENYAESNGASMWAPARAAEVLAERAQELFDILAGLGYQPSAQQQDPLPFAEAMPEGSSLKQTAEDGVAARRADAVAEGAATLDDDPF